MDGSAFYECAALPVALRGSRPSAIHGCLLLLLLLLLLLQASLVVCLHPFLAPWCQACSALCLDASAQVGEWLAWNPCWIF
jgi:hypothetical protein